MEIASKFADALGAKPDEEKEVTTLKWVYQLARKSDQSNIAEYMAGILGVVQVRLVQLEALDPSKCIVPEAIEIDDTEELEEHVSELEDEVARLKAKVAELEQAAAAAPVAAAAPEAAAPVPEKKKSAREELRALPSDPCAAARRLTELYTEARPQDKDAILEKVIEIAEIDGVAMVFAHLGLIRELTKNVYEDDPRDRFYSLGVLTTVMQRLKEGELPAEDMAALHDPKYCARLIELTEIHGEDYEEFVLHCVMQLAVLSNNHVPSNERAGTPLVNAVMHAESKKTFVEQIVQLANRDESRKIQEATLKLLLDVFSCRAAADVFYTNDLHVMIDIFIRELADRDAADPIRCTYLEVLMPMMLNTGAKDDPYRRADLVSALRDQMNADSTSSEAKDVAEAILIACPFLRN